jgi:transcriptional regulator with XRE-family HTH domain
MVRSIADTLRNRLRLWRVDNGLSIHELSDLTGLSTPFLSRVERGERQLAPLTKARVARCLGVPIRDLFDVEEIEEDAAAQ